MIGITGPSCAGKTVLARALAEALCSEGPVLLSMDSYYRDLAAIPLDTRREHNFDTPDAIDAALFEEQMRAIAKGDTIERPVYDFATHTRAPQPEPVAPGGVVIVEGLFALYWEAIRRLYRMKVFVDAPDPVCLARRIARDTRERGRTPESVRRQYEETVRPMAARHVHPARQHADVVLDGQMPLDRQVEAVVAILTQSAEQED